jgi:hypothetical protein
VKARQLDGMAAHHLHEAIAGFLTQLLQLRCKPSRSLQIGTRPNDTEWRRERELDLWIALGRALIVNRSWGASELAEVYSRARKLALTLNRPRALLFALWGQVTDQFQAETLRLSGEVLLAIGDPAAAEASYAEAMAIAQRQSAKLWELRAVMGLARLWRDQGKRGDARDLLAPVYGWFTEGFATPVLQEAKALLGELAA